MNSGVINILKPPGISSGGIVGRIKHILGTKKVGHTGTLDPAAAGVLPICFGRATRLSQYIMDHDKEYIAEICFGASTDTLDAMGVVLQNANDLIEREELLSILPKFTGEIEQYPPAYSAIKINGRKAYELARKGHIPDLKPRNVSVNRIELIEQTAENRYLIRVACSKGTYIRTLVADIAESLGTVAYTSALIRTKCGGFEISNAYDIERIEEMKERGDFSFIDDSESVLSSLPEIQLGTDRRFALSNGLSTKTNFENGLYRLYCGNSFYGVGKQTDGEVKLIIPLDQN